jgi:hypothetical protein
MQAACCTGLAPKPLVARARRAPHHPDDDELMTPLPAYPAYVLLVGTAWLLACSADTDRPRQLTARDSSAIEGVRSAYVRAWLTDDTAGLLATLDAEAVLLPPGHLPISGHRAIREFRWPTDGSRTTTTGFEWTLDELGGTPELAFTPGVSTVA